jgi:hypothetical protein
LDVDEPGLAKEAAPVASRQIRAEADQAQGAPKSADRLRTFEAAKVG